jgi:hypothetical protein
LSNNGVKTPLLLLHNHPWPSFWGSDPLHQLSMNAFWIGQEDARRGSMPGFSRLPPEPNFSTYPGGGHKGLSSLSLLQTGGAATRSRPPAPRPRGFTQRDDVLRGVEILGETLSKRDIRLKYLARYRRAAKRQKVAFWTSSANSVVPQHEALHLSPVAWWGTRHQERSCRKSGTLIRE